MYEPVKADGISYNGVDYAQWVGDPRHKKALELLLVQKPKALTGEGKKAFWINAYNFLTIELIIHEGERESIKNLGSFFSGPWKRYDWSIGGHDYTLDDIEHIILRPMDDARIHFAINCASISCPDLRMESYRAEALDSQLDEQVKIALGNKEKVLRIENNTIFLSKIFSWFKKDFNDGDIKNWLRQYKDIDQGASIRFMNYNWSLNKVN